MSAQKVNLELQMKFLDQLQSAVTDALERFDNADRKKVAELEYIDKEVQRARRIVSTRIEDRSDRQSPATDPATVQHAAL